MNGRINRLLSTSLFGLTLAAGGCAAHDVDVRTRGDSTSATGRGQVNTETSESSKRGSSGQTGGTVSGSGAVSGSGSGSGSVSGSGTGTIQK
jgi:hypothetical protein